MVAPALSHDRIPILDLSAFTTHKSSATAATQRQTADDLMNACAQYGCVGVAGHGLSSSTLDELWQTSRRIFSMSHEEKMKAPHPTNSWIPHRGFTPIGGEKAFNKADMTEHGNEKDFWKTKKSITDYKVGEPRPALQ